MARRQGVSRRAAKAATSDGGRKRAIGYVRVSTAGQAEAGVSLQVQRAKLESYAGLHELDLVGIVEDAGASAKTMDREGLQRVLDMVRRREVAVVLVYQLDRLTRSIRDLNDILELCDKQGVELASFVEKLDTGSAGGRMVINVMGAVSQWQREYIVEKTIDAMADKRARGEKTGGDVPYGYRAVAARGAKGQSIKRLVPVPREQAAVELALKLHGQGRSLRAIAGELQAAGFRPRGKRAARATWHPQTVANILRFRDAQAAAA